MNKDNQLVEAEEKGLLKKQSSQKEDWEMEFDEEFVATGADIEEMKRVEYRHLREHQVDELKTFIRQLLAEVRAEEYRNGSRRIKAILAQYKSLPINESQSKCCIHCSNLTSLREEIIQKVLAKRPDSLIAAKDPIVKVVLDVWSDSIRELLKR